MGGRKRELYVAQAGFKQKGQILAVMLWLLVGDRRAKVNSGLIGLRQEGVLQQRTESGDGVGWRAVLMDH